jgi:hypothetical protein
MELKPEHKPNPVDWHERNKQRIKDRYGEPVRTIWRIIECIDGWDQDGNWIEGRARTVDKGEWLTSKEEAEELISKMKPSSGYYGAELKLESKTLYRKLVPEHWQETWL